jgi:hypothetical protein
VSLVDETSQTEHFDAAVKTPVRQPEPGHSDIPPMPPVGRTDLRFWLAVTTAVALGAVVRLSYLYSAAPALPGADGLDFHITALRLADGLGYTAGPLTNLGEEAAHDPPGWGTLLGGVAEAGGRSLRTHQLTALVIGLGVILLAGLVGRRYAGRRVGVAAAFLAAAYPGFWVLEAQVLSEPLSLLVVGLLMLVLADLWDRPSLARAILAGAIAGVLALVRSEQLGLLVIALVPILLLSRHRVTMTRRLAWASASTVTALVLIAPWTIHNLGRFEEPVMLSTNLGPTLLSGNCPSGGTYGGETMGSYHLGCLYYLAGFAPDLDWSQEDVKAQDLAFDNMRANIDQLPATVVARHGRTLGVFRPAQTVGIVAAYMNSPGWPVWAWVTSFWLIAPLAIYGSVLLRKSGGFQWPLVAPVVIVLLVVTVAFGDPRYHAPADLGLVVLAAVALGRLTRWPMARWSVRSRRGGRCDRGGSRRHHGASAP